MLSSTFHNALILSIVEMVKENEGIRIFDFIQMMITETNSILSPGDINLGPSSVSMYVERYINGKYSYPLVSHHYGTPREKIRILYRECLLKIHKHFNRDWGGISWFDFLTYLLFIQSNCHHKGNPFSTTPKLCRSPDSFLDFFYKSKSAFNPWSQWEKLGVFRSTPGFADSSWDIENIPPTKTSELRGEWWIKAFEREKKIFLMFETLAPSHYLGNRFTIGWVVRRCDILPQGSVLNQLRKYYELPELSGDYGLGCMSERSHVFKGSYNKENGVEKNKGNEIQDEMCMYFNLGFCVGCGLICMARCLKNN